MPKAQTVTRRYSIKRILSQMEEWQYVKTMSELKAAWGTEGNHYANRLINSTLPNGPKLGEERLLQAMKVLGVGAEDICTPFTEEIQPRAKA